MKIQSFLPQNTINYSNQISPSFKGEWEQKGITPEDNYDPAKHAAEMAEIKANHEAKEEKRKKAMGRQVKNNLARLTAALLFVSAGAGTCCKLNSTASDADNINKVKYFELFENPRVINHALLGFSKDKNGKGETLNINNKIFIESKNKTNKKPQMAFSEGDSYAVVMGNSVVEYTLNPKTQKEGLFINGNEIECVPSIDKRTREKPLRITIEEDGTIEVKGSLED